MAAIKLLPATYFIIDKNMLMNITFDMIPQCLSEIIERLGKIEQRLEELMEENKNDEFFPSTYRKVKRGKLAKQCNVVELERQGKLTSYASEVNVITNVPRLKI